MISTTTISGADDSVSISDLALISNKFPFVEWGILLSRSQQGTSRFPSRQWREELALSNGPFRLAGHLCGAYVRELLCGSTSWIEEVGSVWKNLSRIQINFHGQPRKLESGFVDALLTLPEKEFIFQWDNVNTHLLTAAQSAGVNCSALFDLSHGTGMLPNTWPTSPTDFSFGYAGGLGPHNLTDQLPRIMEAAAGRRTWIDMETHVRTGDTLDLAKVENVLEQVNQICLPMSDRN